ncbi:hypothetical protein [Halobacillus faecis]|nr:hypothetical protein [Halobacillus faecis]
MFIQDVDHPNHSLGKLAVVMKIGPFQLYFSRLDRWNHPPKVNDQYP